ncbi:MAG: hypothetical protein PVF91_00265 [Chromatiales bacterium]|jgi:hypothetical protein
MTEAARYRRLTRRQTAALVIGVLALGGLAVWGSAGWADAYTAWMSDLVAASPERAAAELQLHLKVLSVAHCAVGWAVAAFVAWYGYRGLRAASMPPPGAWVMEGQRIREGPQAVRVSKILMALGGAIALLSTGISLTLWRLAVRASEFVR